MQAENTAISIEKVVKYFGAFTALKQVSLQIQNGEFFTLLGPSGCGKTTLLRLIAGFESTSQGKIFLFGDEIENLPANKRPINTVFQHYALFPHMNIRDNIKFGMRMLKFSKQEMDHRADEMLELVQLSHFSQRKPHELSGGQQQRVALARALAPRPKVLLLDEPLSALDLKLRQSMRAELKQIQQETGITFVFVTHDQEEALAMSDRIAVMSAGEVQQVGTPKAIYDQPANSFVADFIGETNLLDATVEQTGQGTITCRLDNQVRIQCPNADASDPPQQIKLSIRPERLSFSTTDTALMTGHICQKTYMGTDTQFVVDVGQGLLVKVRAQNNLVSTDELHQGHQIGVNIDAAFARVLVN